MYWHLEYYVLTSCSGYHASDDQDFGIDSEQSPPIEVVSQEAKDELAHSESGHEDHFEPDHAAKRLLVEMVVTCSMLTNVAMEMVVVGAMVMRIMFVIMSMTLHCFITFMFAVMFMVILLLFVITMIMIIGQV